MRILRAALLAALATGIGACSGSDSSDSTTTFRVRIDHVGTAYDLAKSGVFNTPVGKASPGGIGPGDAYEVSFTAAPGHKLSFAAMFVPSNDLFFAPSDSGIELFDASGAPVTGDITSQIMLWDAGTELNEEPGAGPYQPMRQSGANSGAVDTDSNVRLATDDFSNLPAAASVIKASLAWAASTGFTLRIENVSTATTLSGTGGAQAVPVAPGVWAIHTGMSPLFQSGAANAGMGLEALAEDGDPTGLVTALVPLTGLTAPVAPGTWAVHMTTAGLFTDGVSATPGLQALAEDGDPSLMATGLSTRDDIASSGVFNTPAGASGPGPLVPGGAYEFTVEAMPGDRLSLAAMFVQSNDLFYGAADGVALFGTDDMPITGDVTAMFNLWDAGTEMNMEPGIGGDQPLRQSAANTGTDEGGTVHLTSDSYSYGAVSDTVRITITPVTN